MGAGAGDLGGPLTTGDGGSGGGLHDRVALVTGASSGIGAACAAALAREGVRVGLAARRRDELARVQSGLQPGSASVVVPMDVTVREEVADGVAAVEAELGPIDVVVHCAGVMYYTLMEHVDVAQWEATVDVNCRGLLHVVAATLPGLLERGGHLVAVSSDAGRTVFPGLAVYSASKFFTEALARGLRLETVGSGLRVTTVQPGNVATDLLAMSTDADAVRRYGEPTGARVLDPADVARSVVHVLRQPPHVAINELLVEPRDEPT